MMWGLFSRLAEGLCLVVLGLFAVDLAAGDSYSMYLNPRFAWLTGGAGVALALFGLLRLTSRGGKGAPARLVMFLAILALAGLSRASLVPPSGSVTGGGKAAKINPLLEREGVSYTKINPAELFYVIKEDKSAKVPGPFVARGVARRTPEMDALGRFYFVRLNMVCCAADAVGLGVIVQLPSGAKLPEDWQWTRVFGSLAPLTPGGKLMAAPPPEGKVTSLVSPKALLTAAVVEAIDRPPSPYVFALGAEPPYQY